MSGSHETFQERRIARGRGLKNHSMNQRRTKLDRDYSQRAKESKKQEHASRPGNADLQQQGRLIGVIYFVDAIGGGQGRMHVLPEEVPELLEHGYAVTQISGVKNPKEFYPEEKQRNADTSPHSERHPAA